MPPTYKVIITRRALAQLQEIAKYILEDSPQNAEQVADAVVAAIDSLAELPARFKRVGTSRALNSPIHMASAAGFMIYFRLQADQRVVHVLTIVRGAHRQPRSFA